MEENISIFKMAEKSNFVVNLMVMTCNGLNITKDFLRLFKQNTPNIDTVHLLLLDNGSTDGTVEYLKLFSNDNKNATLVLSKNNLGIINGRNLQYKIFNDMDKKSVYSMFLDNDQLVQPGWLESHIRCIELGYDMVGIEAWQMNERFIPCLKISDSKQHYCYVGCGGMLIKKEVTDKIGMFDPQFNPCYFEDPDFCWSAYKEGFKIGWNPKSKVLHIPHQTLGKMGVLEKSEKFTNSWKKFRNKWQKFNPPKLILEK